MGRGKPCEHTPGHNTSKWTAAAQVANWESDNQGTQQTLHLLCIIDLDSNASTHKHTHMLRGGEKNKEKEGERDRKGGRAAWSREASH